MQTPEAEAKGSPADDTKEKKEPQDEAVKEKTKTDSKEAKDSEEKASDKASDKKEESKKEDSKEASKEESKDESSDKDSDDDKKGKGFFKKKPDPRDQKIADLTDRVQRQMAEFDNFRKRTEKEKGEMFDAGARHILEKILPVVDNFERALALRPEGEDNAYADGIEKIYKGLVKTLDDLDVKEIDAEGKEFDPNFHNAVMHVEDDSLGDNVVAEVLQKGYTFHDVVIRHAMVKVAN
ncbi:MAG: nucleotide exchange factor GrpE [Lachnospiraceae bacterium]|nr:nucleotide exchange factor GrpE [Lachnospiraceae bacterium]